jgi:hypothetical protein
MGPAIAFIAQAILCAGWVMYASWVTDSVRAIDNKTPNPTWNSTDVENARQWVVILSWVEAAMLGIMASVSLLTGCCCPDNEKRTV